uniref:Tetraspanin n=1 Tax=Timema cristinae TaxID=61476 RepID=A0A7R9D9M8_TIMCR|nr:unnamed protein product [Timema cristinae]
MRGLVLHTVVTTMKMSELTLGKGVLVCCNFFFMVSGSALVVLGALLLTDVPRVLLSRLLTPTEAPPHPLFYYVALGFMALGIVVCATGVLGWWAVCLNSYCILATYLFLLVVLLLGECSFSVLATLCPQYLGVGVGSTKLVEALQRRYGVPGKDQFTAAVDLAQTMFQCCGIGGAVDYDTSWWRLRELGQRELVVPHSCCLLSNPPDDDRAFLDPRPLNVTTCQSEVKGIYSLARHTEGCIGKLGTWFRDHTTLFLAIGSGVVLVELAVLLSAILVWGREEAGNNQAESYARRGSSANTTSEGLRHKGSTHHDNINFTNEWQQGRGTSEGYALRENTNTANENLELASVLKGRLQSYTRPVYDTTLKNEGCQSVQRSDVDEQSGCKLGGTSVKDKNLKIRADKTTKTSKKGKIGSSKRFKHKSKCGENSKELSFYTLPYVKGAGIGGSITKSTFGKSGTYTLKCNLKPLLTEIEFKNKRKCIYEKNPGSKDSVLRQLDQTKTADRWLNPQSRINCADNHASAETRSESVESDSMMW